MVHSSAQSMSSIYLVTALFLAGFAYAETTDKAGNLELGGGSGLANKIASPIINSYDPNSINYTDAEAKVDSRKNAATTAGKSSGKGSAVHAAIGSAMIATGTPMAASTIRAVRTAGRVLIAKGIIELAQSGADSSVQNQNNAQRDLLTQQANQGGRQATAEEASKAITSNPEVNKFLTDQGINPDSLAQQVASGELSDPESVVRAISGGDEPTAEEMAEANAMATSQEADIFGQVAQAEGSREKLGYDESNPVMSADGVARGDTATVAAGGRPVTAANSKIESELSKALTLEGDVKAFEQFAPNQTKSSEIGNKNLAPPGFDAGSFLSAIFGADGELKPTEQAAQMALEQLGIRKLKKGKNIFQQANYHYRDWGRWSKKRRLRLIGAASASLD